MQTIKKDSSEDSKVDNRLKIDFADLVNDAKSVVGFSASCQFKLKGMTSPKYCLPAYYSFKLVASKVEIGFLSRRISSGW